MAETAPNPAEEAIDPIVRRIADYHREAESARRERLAQNRRNREVFFGRQDWSHKQDGQSTEFLPKVSNSVEQMASFIKRGLIQFGDWFSMDVDRTLAKVVDGSQLRTILKCYLSNLWKQNNQSTSFPIVMSDVVKNGLLESLMILKVHGGTMPTRTYSADRSGKDVELTFEEGDEWRLRIDLVRPEDYYPDPTGNGLYEIHEVERDLHEVIAASEGDDAIYDPEMVRKLIGEDAPKSIEESRTDNDRGQLPTSPPVGRKRVRLREFWGTILNEDGTVQHRNVVCTIANGKWLIRKPEPNPFWHQESPFVVEPLIRVPWSVWHKALYDHASELNIAVNEMFNLILDGGLAAVWGVRQVRLEDLEDPGQVANGVPQGSTLAVKSTLAHNAKVVETVTTGNVPNDAMAIFQFLNGEYNNAALTNELKLGNFPEKQVRATEVVEASQSQAITLDGIVADLEESFIRRVLKLSWLTILQNADKIPEEAMTGLVDRQVAVLFARASAEERYALFAGRTNFTVNGLSGTMAKAMNFQKLMALQQAIAQNPPLMQASMEEFSAKKTLRLLMRTLNINIADVEKDSEERAQAAQDMAKVAETNAMMNGQGGGEGPAGASAPGAGGAGGTPIGGGSELPAQVNQMVNAQSGLTPNA